MSLEKFIAVMKRHQPKMLDGAGLLLVTLVLGFAAAEADLFAAFGHQDVGASRVTLEEALAVALVFSTGVVIFALRRLSEQRRETAMRIAAERETRALAFQDPLTGLANRRRFEQALLAATQAPPGADSSHVVLMLDLNGFKRVNDLLGHGAGDELLFQVGGRLQRSIRDDDLLARLGGDEFAVLAPQMAGAEAAIGLARRIIDALDAPIAAGGAEHKVGASVGISLSPQDGVDPGELLRKADVALYRSKSQKHLGSQLHFFEPEMDVHLRERDAIERALREAISKGEVRPYFQPLVSLSSNQVVGFESLARWTSPELGVVSPARFIAIAEDSGLIAPLTDQLLEASCRAAAEWPQDVTLAFNVSGALLADQSFGLRLLATLGRTGLSPARLELEITESALVRDLEAARNILGRLRQTGIRVALDDFGTGYSSLYHLRNFDLDKIKIDRSFVETMGADPESAAIVRALVGLGAGLGLTVTAEGVETAEQERMLRAEGCDQAQGYRYSKAVDAIEAKALVSPKNVVARLVS